MVDDLVPAPAAGGRAASAPLLGRDTEPTLFELSEPGRCSWQLRTTGVPEAPPRRARPRGPPRAAPVELAEVSERDLVGHFTRLSHRQFSVDLGAYPLGSCTMKYNPKVCDAVAVLPGLADVHPAAPGIASRAGSSSSSSSRTTLCEITGMAAATLQPAAGAAGELTGLLLMRAWHEARGDHAHKVVIPDSAHGTNPASVTLGGFEVVTVPSDARGLRGRRGAARRARRGRGGDHARPTRTRSGCSKRTSGHRRRRARRGRAPVLRRCQPQRHPGRGAPRRHGLRHRAPEPAQDLRHPPRRRGTGRGPGGGVGAPGAVPARAPAGRVGDAPTARYGWSTRLAPSAGCTRGTATPGARPCPHLRAVHGSDGLREWPSWPCSTPTGCASGCRPASTPPTTAPACTSACCRPRRSSGPRA